MTLALADPPFPEGVDILGGVESVREEPERCRSQQHPLNLNGW
jgi:hypothetical protein